MSAPSPPPPAAPQVPRDPNSAVRRTLLWWFQEPANAHVSINFAVDFTAARAYLAALARQEGPRVTVQHLLLGAVARTLRAFPLANAQVRRNRIVMRDRVGVAMPVNLLGHEGGKQRELGIMLVQDADRLSLRELATASTRSVQRERQGKGTHPLVRLMLKVAERAPQPVFFGVLDGWERLRRAPITAELAFRAAPATTLLSNAGAPLGAPDGVLFRGGAISPPPRLGHVGTVWGSSMVQDEVVVVDGQPAVRPMLPLLLVFDHRLLDGVAAGRLALHLSGLLRAPEQAFGPDGEAPADGLR